jgi:hypothetical protein
LRIFFAFIHPSAWKEISANFGGKKKGRCECPDPP